MKIYRSFTIDMNTGALEKEDSYEYEGPVAECKGGKGGDGGAAEQARKDEQQRQAMIRKGTANINSTFDSQFTDDFYNGRNTAFLNYATPQLGQQYADAQKELAFALDRTGNLNSSARAQKEAELQRLYDQNRQQVADQGLTYQTQAKNNIEDARADLIRTLNATGDAEGAANSALTRSQALSQPDQYSPLGQLFASFTAGLGTAYQNDQIYNASGGQYGKSTGLFSPNPKAVSVS